uniref:Uncharacterized protein n=1 Tax=Arundo donax TaxID=35708 RepID=A0A0A8Z8L2_ARUDO
MHNVNPSIQHQIIPLKIAKREPFSSSKTVSHLDG